MLLLLAVAFLAGVVTALSPCVLPALPVVLAGGAGGGPRRVAGIAVGFVASFTLVTLALATALRSVGLGPDALRNLAIAVLVGVGATLVVPALGERVAVLLTPVARLGERLPRGHSGLAGGLLVGVALGLVWTPCAGPAFAAIAAVAAIGDAGVSAFAVLVAYAAGAVLPLCLIAAGGRRLVGRVRGRWAAAVRPALGVPAGEPLADEAGEAPPDDPGVTPETWVGAARIQRLASEQRVRPLLPTRYRAPAALAPDGAELDGGWTLDDEPAQAGAGAAIELAFRAKGVYLVLDGGAGGGSRAGRVLVDDRAPTDDEAGADVGPGGTLAVDSPRLYRLLQLPRTTDGRLRIELAPGTRAFAFTFV